MAGVMDPASPPNAHFCFVLRFTHVVLQNNFAPPPELPRGALFFYKGRPLRVLDQTGGHEGLVICTRKCLGRFYYAKHPYAWFYSYGGASGGGVWVD